MIIELTGAPGIGKTTLCNDLDLIQSNNIILFSFDLVLKQFKINWIKPNILRHLISDFLHLCYFLISRRHYNAIFKFSIKQAFSTGESIFTKLNISRNIILKLGRYEFSKRHIPIDNILLFDEGISHILFNIANYAEHCGLHTKQFLKLLFSTVENTSVVVVASNDIDLAYRLKNRGHKRIYNGNQYNLDQFISCNNQIIASLKTCINEGTWPIYIIDPQAATGADLLKHIAQK